MLNILNATFTAQQKATKNTSNVQPALSFRAKFNTGQPVKDTVSFSGKLSGKEKRELRQKEAERLQIPQKYDIPKEEVTFHHINAVKAGLDPREAQPHQITAVKLGLDPQTATAKEVHNEPFKRSKEISAKIDSIVYGINDTNLDADQVRAVKDEMLCDIHKEVVEEVLGKLPEGYKPVAGPIFEDLFKPVGDTLELIELLSEEFAIQTSKENTLTPERKEEMLTQINKDNELTAKMEVLFKQKVKALNPDMDKSVYQKADQLRRQAPNMKRADFDAALNKLHG